MWITRDKYIKLMNRVYDLERQLDEFKVPLVKPLHIPDEYGSTYTVDEHDVSFRDVIEMLIKKTGMKYKSGTPGEIV